MTLRDLIRGGLPSLGTTHSESPRIDAAPGPAATFSSADHLTRLFEGESHPGPLSSGLADRDGDLRAAFATLSSSQRASLEARFGASVLQELLALSHCHQAREFAEAVLSLGARQENQGRLDVANALYQAVLGLGEDPQLRGIRERAQTRLNAVLGTGAVLPRTEFLLRRLAAEACEPTALVGMAAAGFAFRFTRLAVLSRLAASPSANFLTRGLGASALSSIVAFGVEAPTFTFAGRLANEALGRSQDWSGAALRRDLASSFLTLGGLKLMGWAAGAGFNRLHGINPLTGQATRLVGLSAVSQRLIPQLGMLGGIMLGHGLEERFGLREHHDGATTMVDSLAMLLQFHVAGAFQAQAFGERVRAWEQGLDQQIHHLEGGNQSTESGSRLGLGIPSRVPALAGGPGGFEGRSEGQGLFIDRVFSVRHEAEGSNPPSPGNGGSGRGTGANRGRGGGGGEGGYDWLRLGQGENRLHLEVPSELLPQAERLAEGITTEGNPPLDAMGQLLQRVLQNPQNRLSRTERLTLLGEVFGQFHDRFVQGNDIHAVTASSRQRAERIASYLQAEAELRAAGAEGLPERTRSALFEAADRGEAGLYAQFGGQANLYFSELRSINETYPEARDFIRQMAEALQTDAASREAQSSGFVSEGLDLMRWIRGEAPGEGYLSSAAVSQPLIAVTQLAHLFVNMRRLGMSPGEFRSRFSRGTTGHSQGIMSSVVMASSATEAEFLQHSANAVRYLLWQGIRMSEAAPETTLRPEIVAASVAAGAGRPTPMMGLLKLSPETVQRYVDRVNAELRQDRPVEISLINGPRAVVVSGHPESLHRLRELLQADAAAGSQSRVPFSRRKLEFVANYFPVYGPYHTAHYMRPVAEVLGRDLQRLGIRFNGVDLAIPVHSTETGENLQGREDLTQELVRLQSTGRVDWRRALSAASSENGVTHLLDFGPGESAGIGAITARLKEGAGVQVILAGSLQSGRGLLDRGAVYDSRPAAVTQALHWGQRFSPRLVRLRDGTLMVDNHFTRSYGRPPVIQAGMTPTSANAEFTAAVARDGFHAELAGGGQHNEAYFRQRVAEIVDRIPAGEGFHANLLFLNQYLWGFQFPLVQVLAREGRPIEGVTLGAGVPSLERSSEIIRDLRVAGIHHIAFKPGSRESIQEVVRIAEANPETTVMLQWTGGRAGGHHSFEDVHDPILQSYAAIRNQRNLVLTFGSGVGDAEHSLPYLTGEWSRAYGVPDMPFDGVLLGSRLMTASEAQTAPEAKELIVNTPGIENESQWEGSYEGPAGGVRTVISELGEPIHKVANRGVELWADFDRRYFSERDPAKREAAIRADRNEIIRRVNADYQKLYFGIERDGRTLHLEDMSYADVARRMVELMHVGEGEGARWIDVTFRDRAFDFLARIEERFHARGEDSEALAQRSDQLERDPQGFMTRLLQRYPQAERQLLAREDIDFFMGLCRRAGKPVNFIPVIDGDLAAWFKRDSLWQSEDLGAVPGQDIGRVAILQGPVAVRYSTRVDEPVGDILDNINQGFVDALRLRYPGEEEIPTVDYLGGPQVRPVSERDIPQVRRTERYEEGREILVLNLPTEGALPDAALYRDYLAGEQPSWWRALLTSPRVLRGRDRVENPMASLLRPRPGQRIEIQRSIPEGNIEAVRVYEDALMARALPEGTPSVPVLAARLEGNNIHVTLNHPRAAAQGRAARILPLSLDYRYEASQGYAPIHESMPNFNARVRQFYEQLWSEVEGDADPGFRTDSVFRDSFQVNGEHLEAFRRAVGNRNPSYAQSGSGPRRAPLDMAIVAAWRPLVQTLFPAEIGGNIFNLVHRSNGFRVLDAAPLTEGQTVATEMRIERVQNTPAGRVVGVRGTLSREGRPWVEITSEFLIRGRFGAEGPHFSRQSGERVVTLSGAEAVSILRSKNWLRLNPGVSLQAGETLRFRYESFESEEPSATGRCVTGLVLGETGEAIGSIEYAGSLQQGSPVESYLQRHGREVRALQAFESGGYNVLAEPDTVRAPENNLPYSQASLDLNPIHDNPYIADFAGLPTTITHGMWTSANARRVVETHLAFDRPERVVSYRASFEGMVRPGDTIHTQLRHVGMREGNQVVEVESANQDGQVVLRATAEVEAPPSAYVFTGQGAQERNMGMDLYQSSPTSKAIWDRADAHFRQQWGFSILDIVRADPRQNTELTIRFGGPEGTRLRERYRALSQEVVVEENGAPVRRRVPLFPELREDSESLTFLGPQGLLNSTQFTQPALMLMEYAGFRDMQQRGLISPRAHFAGHSLGEYAAISSVADVLPLDAVLDITFLR